jgi:hypothetical protein
VRWDVALGRPGRVVHVAAVLLTIWYALGATAALLAGADILLSRVRRVGAR